MSNMEQNTLAKHFEERICTQMTVKSVPPTVSGILKMMLETGLILDDTLRQYLAVSEFHEKYKGEKKTQLIECLAGKYKVGKRTLERLTGKDRRFVF